MQDMNAIQFLTFSAPYMEPSWGCPVATSVKYVICSSKPFSTPLKKIQVLDFKQQAEFEIMLRLKLIKPVV